MMKFILAVIFLVTSCSKETELPNSQKASLPVDESVNSSEEQTFNGQTCADLEVPSWDRIVESLVENRCVRCHNENFAWNGVQLQTYELVKENEELARQRLAKGEFTFDISVLDIMTLEKWFNRGMPRTERDCDPQ